MVQRMLCNCVRGCLDGGRGLAYRALFKLNISCQRSKVKGHALGMHLLYLQSRNYCAMYDIPPYSFNTSTCNRRKCMVRLIYWQNGKQYKIVHFFNLGLIGSNTLQSQKEDWSTQSHIH